MFEGAAVFMILKASDDSVNFLINGKPEGPWRYDWVLNHSEPLNESR
jgi:hypothetical protein